MVAYSIELWRFFVANLRASFFGAFLLAVFLVTEVVGRAVEWRFWHAPEQLRRRVSCRCSAR
jgi:hypothetical protein